MSTEEMIQTHDESCSAVQALLSPYVDGEATTQEIVRIERHLVACVSCRSSLAFLKVLTKTLPAPPLVLIPSWLSERIALATYDRPSLWDRLLVALRPAPARFALAGALTATTLCVVLLPRLSQTNRVAIVPVSLPSAQPTLEPARREKRPATPLTSTVPPVISTRPALAHDRTVPTSVARKPKEEPATHAPKLVPSLPTDHHALVATRTSSENSSLPLPPLKDAPKAASTVAAAPVAGHTTTSAEALSTPAPVIMVALGARPQAGTHGLIETSGEEQPSSSVATPADGKVKVALNITSKQMKDASSAISSLNAGGGEYQAGGRNLTIVSSPVR